MANYRKIIVKAYCYNIGLVLLTILLAAYAIFEIVLYHYQLSDSQLNIAGTWVMIFIAIACGLTAISDAIFRSRF